MKFALALALVAAATLASAESNAARFARGMPPNAPHKRGTPVARAHQSTPSGSPGQCDTGSIQCCDSFGKAGEDDKVDDLLHLFNVKHTTDDGTNCGVSCSSVTGVGGGDGGGNCVQQPVCCDNNNFNGLIVIGCSPINIFL